METVIVTDVAPTLTVVKSVNHEFIPDPGGGVTYTVVVTIGIAQIKLIPPTM